MRFVMITARKDLVRMLRDPVALIAWMINPAIITLLIVSIFGSGNTRPQGVLLLDDQDKSLVSAAILNVFRLEPLKTTILLEPTRYEPGRKRLDAGDASGLLVIPEGFGKAYLTRQPAKLTLWTNPSQNFLPGIIRDALGAALDGAFYRQAGVTVNPSLIEVQTNVKATGPPPSLAVLFYPGMIVLSIFGLAQSSSEDIWRERTHGTLRRVITTSKSVGAFLLGKLSALLLLFGAVAAFGIGIARVALHAPVQNFAVAVVWISSAGIGLYLIAAMLQVFATEQRAGAVLNSFVMFILAAVGGTFFPFEIMPPWLAAIGRYTPNGWAIARYKEIAGGTVSPAHLAVWFAMLFAFIAVASVFLSRRLRRWVL